VTLGVAQALIGAVFSLLTGHADGRLMPGRPVSLSFSLLGAVACASFAGLCVVCYAEMAMRLVPIRGSATTYDYENRWLH